MATHSPARMSPADHFRAHLALARISNTPTVVSNVLAGAVLAAPLVLDRTIVFVVIAMALFYTAGMYLNDIFDYEIDVRDRPERPLPSGRVGITVAWMLTIAMAGLGLALLATVSTASFISGLLLVALIAVYDFWHKGNPIGPLLMAGTRVLVYVAAFTAYSTAFMMEFVLWCIVMLAYVSGLTSVAKTESLPSVGRYWPLVAVLLPAAALVSDPANVGVWLLALVFIGWVVYSVRFAYRQTNRQVGGAIARLIAGISLVDALVLATHETWWGVLIALVAFAATIFFQRYIRGT
jgi:4-hydroxybenzoate polyprenyltransferase